MPYAVEDDVIALLGDQFSVNSPLDSSLNDADTMVELYCLGSSYSAKVLRTIAKYLAAHFYEMTYGRTIKEQIGSSGSGGGGAVSVTYESKVDLGFNLTRFGQQAMMWDKAGNLARANADAQSGRTRQQIYIRHLGKDLCEQELNP